MEDEVILIERPSKAKRLLRSTCARLRRKIVKNARAIHEYKEEKDARARVKAKRRLEKNKRKSSKSA